MKTSTLAVRARVGLIVAMILVTATIGFAQGVVIQLLPLFYPNGEQLESVNGEPLDAALNRFPGFQKERIYWALMTQHLVPGEKYDIWLEGDSAETGSFIWWAGRAAATPQGKLNASGTIYASKPAGPALGSFTDATVEITMVIKTVGGTTVQLAYFPGI